MNKEEVVWKDVGCECARWARSFKIGRNTSHHSRCEHHEKETQKKPFVKIAPIKEPANFYVDKWENFDTIKDMLSDCEENDGYIIKKVMMSEFEYNCLNEFKGF